jgi:hypothetical protein
LFTLAFLVAVTPQALASSKEETLKHLLEQYRLALNELEPAPREKELFLYAELQARAGMSDECLRTLKELPVSNTPFRVESILAQLLASKNETAKVRLIADEASLKLTSILEGLPKNLTSASGSLERRQNEGKDYLASAPAMHAFINLIIIQSLAGDLESPIKTIRAAWAWGDKRFPSLEYKEAFVKLVFEGLIMRSEGALAALVVDALPKTPDNKDILSKRALESIAIRCIQHDQIKQFYAITSKLDIDIKDSSRERSPLQEWMHFFLDDGNFSKWDDGELLLYSVRHRAKERPKPEFYGPNSNYLGNDKPIEHGKAIIPAVDALSNASSYFIQTRTLFTQTLLDSMQPAVNSAASAYTNTTGLGRRQIMDALLAFKAHTPPSLTIDPRSTFLETVFFAQLSRSFTQKGLTEESRRFAIEARVRYELLNSNGPVGDAYRQRSQSFREARAVYRQLREKLRSGLSDEETTQFLISDMTTHNAERFDRDHRFTLQILAQSLVRSGNKEDAVTLLTERDSGQLLTPTLLAGPAVESLAVQGNINAIKALVNEQKTPADRATLWSSAAAFLLDNFPPYPQTAR